MKVQLSALLISGLLLGCGPMESSQTSMDTPAASATGSPTAETQESTTTDGSVTGAENFKAPTADSMPEEPATTSGFVLPDLDLAPPTASEQLPASDTTGEVSSEQPQPESGEEEKVPTEYNPLTPEEARVILKKGTERPWIGEYTDTEDAGTYICRRCNAALYKSDSKFHSNCGWPAFDDEIPGAVERIPDADGFRTEIICKNCGGHLGHVFLGEGFTATNTRHCVNSLSMKLIPEGQKLPPVIKPQGEEKKP